MPGLLHAGPSWARLAASAPRLSRPLSQQGASFRRFGELSLARTNARRVSLHLRRPSPGGLANATAELADLVSSRAATKHTPAFTFDIDGVLKQGQHVLPQAKQALKILAGDNPLGKKYPFICVTNGGVSPVLRSSARLPPTDPARVPCRWHARV